LKLKHWSYRVAQSKIPRPGNGVLNVEVTVPDLDICHKMFERRSIPQVMPEKNVRQISSYDLTF